MRKFLSLILSSTSTIESVSSRVNSNSPSVLLKNSCLPYLLSLRTMGSVICKNAPPSSSGKSEGAGDGNNTTMSQDDYIESIVCKNTDINENEMKSFDLEDAGKVLVIRQKGQLSAIGNKCSHYGAPLSSGALGNGYVRCPWHGACFNTLTGDIEDFPGLDSLPCFQVSVTDDDMVKVRARRSELKAGKRIKEMATRNPVTTDHYVVIGGGPSGAVCVETLRQNGFRGRITLINKENAVPYDRIKLSKALNSELDAIQLRKKDFYRQHSIELELNNEATKIDTFDRRITLKNGSTLRYDKLYIATGSKPRPLEVPGANVPQVFVLRSIADSKAIFNELAPEKHVICLGGSFISMEAAASAVDKVKSVTVVARGNAPFTPVFGEDVGKRVMQLFEEKGVTFVMNSGIQKCNEENGQLKSVELLDGSTLPCDVLVTGLGSTFYTTFLENSGLLVNNDGSITVNEFLETNVKGVFAGGDIAFAPVATSDNRLATIGHFPLAHYHGKIAAMNMLNINSPLNNVPFFWTMLFGKSLRYAGHGRHDEIKIMGNLAELKYYAFHFKNDEVIAMSSCGMDPVVSQFANYLQEGKKLFRKNINEEDPLAWLQK